MYEKMWLLINGASGNNEIQKNLDATISTLALQTKEITITFTQEKGHTEQLCREQGNRYDIVMIMGGDGTVHEAINGLSSLDDPPVTGILPTGTCNDFSRSLMIPQNLKKAAAVVEQNHIQYVDIGKMNDRYFSNFYGVGLIAETSENIDDQLKGMLGKVSYFISALQTFNNASPFAFTLKADGKEYKDEAVMILLANGHFIGTNRLPGDQISLHDGLIDVYIIKESGAPLLKEFFNSKNPFMYNLEQSSIEYIQAAEVELETENTMKADTDGEMYEETPVHIKVMEKKIPFLFGEILQENNE